MTEKNLLTAKEVADIIGVKPSTAYDWANQGLIPSLKLNGARRFLRKDVMTWVEDCKRSSDKYNVDAGRRPRKGGLH